MGRYLTINKFWLTVSIPLLQQGNQSHQKTEGLSVLSYEDDLG